ncbi:MAG: sulfatase-like hydrolase/transferase [Anaerotignum sp.]|nr:sulfatase-like hydrolase/transferase [Anaerotignum sp.]
MPNQNETKPSLLYRIKTFIGTPAGISLSVLFWSVFITGIVYLITTTQILRVGWRIVQAPTMLLLNILPVLLLILLLFFLTKKLFFSVSCSAVLFIFFAVTDRIKVIMRQEPLLPTDLTLIKETVAILKTFPVYQLVLIGLMLAAFVVLLVLSFRKSGKTMLPIVPRAIGLVLVIACAFGTNQFLYADKTRYDAYPTVDNPYFQVNQYNTKGMIYSFLHQYNITQMTAPEGYDAKYFAELEDSEWAAPPGEKYPHIIMIMGEAFSDLSENEHLDFTGYRDPLQNFKAISSSDNAYSGHIVVPNFGGGTSNSEYDVLTGCATRYLDNPLPSYNFIHGDFDGIPRQLQKVGYETLSIHPGYAWFYNRQNVYPDLGFETCYFLEDSFDLKTQGYGGYINEAVTMDKIIDTLDTHIKEKDSPLFSFTVTIQNHGPYEKHYGTLPANFSTDVPLDENQTDLLTQYFAGVIDADEQIGRLKEYAENSDEPIVLVYFGDHLPGFSNGMEFFDLLDYPIDANGTPAEQLAVYETPYFIWQNDSAEALCGNIREAAAELELPKDGLMSSQFLGTTILDLFVPGYESPLHQLNHALRKELPVCAKNIYVDAEGNYTECISAEQQEMVKTLKNWQYFKLFDEKNP